MARQKREFTLSHIAAHLGGELRGDGSIKVGRVWGIEDAREGDITFVGNRRYRKFALTTRASCIVVSSDFTPEREALIIVDNPYLAFIRLLDLFHPPERADEGEGFLSADASISPSAALGKGVRIHPFSYVGEGVELGDGTTILPGSTLMKGVKVGRGCWIGSCVFMNEGVVAGNEVIIHSGSVLGADGFGFVRHGEGYLKIPQKGGVIIRDRVEIGAGVTIDRPPVGYTEVGEGTKIDNLVHLGHGVKVGKNCILVAQCGISGSTCIEDGAILAGQVGVVGHVRIGKGSVIGAKSGVSNDVPDEERYTGYPAIPHRDFLRVQAHIKTLPQVRDELLDLKARIRRMEEMIGKLQEKGGNEDGT